MTCGNFRVPGSIPSVANQLFSKPNLSVIVQTWHIQSILSIRNILDFFLCQISLEISKDFEWMALAASLPNFDYFLMQLL